jgi:hypothetical protein
MNARKNAFAAIRGHLLRDEAADSIAEIRPFRPRTRAHRDGTLVALRGLACALAVLVVAGLVVLLAGSPTSPGGTVPAAAVASTPTSAAAYVPVPGVPDPRTGRPDLGPYPVAPFEMTDQQLADALNAVCARHPGACTARVTVVNLRAVFVPWICYEVAQLDAPQPAGNAAWLAAWSEIGPLVVSSGRCS